MDCNRAKRFHLVVCLILCFMGLACEPTEQPIVTKDLVTEINLGTTIGSLVEVFSFDYINVAGYNLVGNLAGTGSSQCPPEVREQLKKYILKQLPQIDADKLIDSKNTAVVLIEGLMPTAGGKNQRFDVLVSALPGSDTVSLIGGELWGTDLKEAGKLAYALRILGKAEGAVYVDQLDDKDSKDKKVGYVLNGGSVADDYKISLALKNPDYKIASLIRNRLNQRFGPQTAKAVSSNLIELEVPRKYVNQTNRFILILRSLYLQTSSDIQRERIKNYVRKLAVDQQKDESEIALESIGKQSVELLSALLNSSKEEVRFRAARCILNLGDDRGLDILRDIAMDSGSSYRIEALKAIAAGANRNDAASVGRRLLNDSNIDIRLAGYNVLSKLEDLSISRENVGDKFYLDQVVQTHYKSIYVTRSGQPKVVFLGSPIICKENIFVQSKDGNIVINAPAGQKFVSIIRKFADKPEIPFIQLKSSYDLGDIVKTLCEKPHNKEHPGLNVSYSDLLPLLKQMSEKGGVKADFKAGPLPDISQIIKK